MVKIPRTVHFVFGLKQQFEAFHLLHYLAIESCRRVLEPDRILFHYHHLPFGIFWEKIRPELELCRVQPVSAVNSTKYNPEKVPEAYRYAHHADFIRLDALLEHGGIYADIDTFFIRPYPDELFEHEFVIGREAPVFNEETGHYERSLCNALMMAQPGARLVRTWRDQMTAALDGSWSQHSCQLVQRLADEYPDQVHIEPQQSFMGIPLTPEGLSSFLEEEPAGGPLDLDNAYSVHLWQHLWWDHGRTDFSSCSQRSLTLSTLRQGRSQLSQLARDYLPDFERTELDGLTR